MTRYRAPAGWSRNQSIQGFRGNNAEFSRSAAVIGFLNTSKFVFRLIQTGNRRAGSTTAAFAHLGALGLFLFAVLDSSPIPTFGGTDILTALLAATRPHPWWEFAVAASAGSVVGAFVTFRIGRRAGRAYLDHQFRGRRAQRFFRFYNRWGTGALVASTAIPFPFPTSIFFATAGASGRHSTQRFLAIVAACRMVRYGAVALVAHVYGRHIVRVLRHPAQHWHWLLLLFFAFVVVVLAAILLRRLFLQPNAETKSVPSESARVEQAP